MKIETIIIAGCILALNAIAQVPPERGDIHQASRTDTLLQDMSVAFKKNDSKTLSRLLPRVKGHLLESWAAYWELKARLPQATARDVDAFLKRFAGTYVEDRLRADWLLQLAQDQDWSRFATYYAAYRMRDDKDIACYANQDNAELVESMWMSQKEQRTGCGWVATRLTDAGKMPPIVAWRKQWSSKAVLPAEPTAQQRDWVLGFEGRTLAQRLDLAALDVFAKVSNPTNLSDDMLAWWTRTALRKQDWPLVQRLIAAMSLEAQKYWAVWTRAPHITHTQIPPEWGDISKSGEGSGAKTANAPPAALPGLTRALHAIQIGLRAEGVREWNYEVNLARGSMNDDERLAVAEMACKAQVWDRCINTSERTKGVIDWSQRYPTPYRTEIVAAAKAQGLEPAFVFGLIRQESRFVVDIRSSVGAGGLMQLMPATARWTAKRIGLSHFTPDLVTDPTVNAQLGAAYLKHVLDEFGGHPALAAAAYNAGPYRIKSWLQAMPRYQTPLELAIWIENIPFAETRDYVKRVSENTKVYEHILRQEQKHKQ